MIAQIVILTLPTSCFRCGETFYHSRIFQEQAPSGELGAAFSHELHTSYRRGGIAEQCNPESEEEGHNMGSHENSFLELTRGPIIRCEAIIDCRLSEALAKQQALSPILRSSPTPTPTSWVWRLALEGRRRRPPQCKNFHLKQMPWFVTQCVHNKRIKAAMLCRAALQPLDDWLSSLKSFFCWCNQPYKLYAGNLESTQLRLLLLDWVSSNILNESHDI